MRFQIIMGYTTQPKEQWAVFKQIGEYNPRQRRYAITEEWDNPQEAAALVKEMNTVAKQTASQQVFMMQRIPDAVDFQVREANRTDYKPFEVQGEPHHCAELIGEKISYYETLNDAYGDIRRTKKLGRYLRQYTELGDNEIADICARHGVECNDCELKIALTREEIRHVYLNGPNSCMAREPSAYYGYSNNCDIHPTEAYASGDIGVAYIIRDERITARVVVTLKEKKYFSVYGDKTRLKPLLDAAGYTEVPYTYNGSFVSPLDGLKLLKLDVGNGYAAPYLDTGDGVSFHEDEKYLVIDKHGTGTCEDGYVTYDMCRPDDEDDYGYDDYCDDPDCEQCHG